ALELKPVTAGRGSPFGDLLSLLRELLEVLSGTALGDERIGALEPPTREPNPHSSIHAPELAATRRAGRRSRAERLDLLVEGPAGPAAIFVQGHQMRL